MATINYRFPLQLAVALGAVVPVTAGVWGAVDLHGDARVFLASHHHYLSGLLLAIGLGFWSTIPNIEQRTQRFRLLTTIVVIGGLCRLLGVMLGDALTPSVAGALVMELMVTPLLCLWQGRVGRGTMNGPAFG